ncbi:MAG: acyl-CoA carboxylase subunit beta, partial [Dethiobacteria bacterium]
AHFVYRNDEECLQGVRRLLSFLPLNNIDDPPSYKTDDDPNRANDDLMEVVPSDFRVPYDVKKVITRIVDDGDFMEILPKYAQTLVIGFARLDGSTVGIVANQPLVMAGCLDIDSSDKGARFIRFCDAFNIPLVNLVDVPGFMPGKEQEYGGIIRHGAKMLYAYSEATVPKITLNMRKNYGGAVMAMCCKGTEVDQMFAWPIAQPVVLDTAAAVDIIFRKELTEAEDKAAEREKRIRDYDYSYSNPFNPAGKMLLDDVIEPQETRSRLISALRMMKTKHEEKPRRKHGNIPL